MRLAAVESKVDIIMVSQVLHQWNWDVQLEAAKALARYSTASPDRLSSEIRFEFAVPRDILKILPAPLWRQTHGCALFRR